MGGLNSVWPVAKSGPRCLVSMVGSRIGNRRNIARLTVIDFLPGARSNLLALEFSLPLTSSARSQPTFTHGGAPAAIAVIGRCLPRILLPGSAEASRVVHRDHAPVALRTAFEMNDSVEAPCATPGSRRSW
jgi:hypothetical protein